MSKPSPPSLFLYMACLVAAIALLTKYASFEVTLNFRSLAKTPSQTANAVQGSSIPTEKIRILSWEPFIMHIEDFIPLEEREYLLNHSKALLEPSTVQELDGSRVPSSYRTSSTAFLSRKDPVVQRVAKRAGQFQGYLEVDDIQVTSYQQGQQYRPHHDWFGDDDLDSTTDRLSTFFAILESDCSFCGTQFPLVPFDPTGKDPEICRFVDCEQKVLTSRNIPGSAVYWRNLDADGEGREDTLHAGLPAVNGTKVGLNIWTYVDITGEFFDRPSYHAGHERRQFIDK